MAIELQELLATAAELRDRHKGRTVTFSPKVFVPLTNLCRDFCGYCTFRKAPGEPGAKTMTLAEVLRVVRQGKAARLHGSIVQPRRQTGGDLPRDETVLNRAWPSAYARLSRRGLPRGPRRNRTLAPLPTPASWDGAICSD